jgi:hypothetical protein
MSLSSGGCVGGRNKTAQEGEVKDFLGHNESTAEPVANRVCQ